MNTVVLMELKYPGIISIPLFRRHNYVHEFYDASEQAFGAVVYMRSVYEKGNIEVSLVTSKIRVVPTKKQTNHVWNL